MRRSSTGTPEGTARLGDWGEFLALRLFVSLLGVLPGSLARKAGAGIGWIAFHSTGRLRAVGEQNLSMALPELSELARTKMLKTSYRRLGIQLTEFCRMAGWGRAEASDLMRYDGLDRFQRAQAKGRGVFVLTGHLGAWELSSFYHSLMGYPMDMVIRRLDNPLIDKYVNRIRCLHGNRVLHKDDFARGLISSIRAGRAVGVLMDTNMTPPQGVFVPFFGVQACTASGVARVALKTGAVVLPGFLVWEQTQQRYVLHFGEEIDLSNTGNAEADALTNTARFTQVLENYIRAYPEQWLWMHRRWKTRPEGEGRIYQQ